MAIAPLLVSGTARVGKTVGIVGFGAIGKAVARMLSGFGCTILYHKPKPLDAEEDPPAHDSLSVCCDQRRPNRRREGNPPFAGAQIEQGNIDPEPSATSCSSPSCSTSDGANDQAVLLRLSLERCRCIGTLRRPMHFPD